MTKKTESTRAAAALEPESLVETVILYQRPIIIGALLAAVGGVGFWLWSRTAEIKEARAGEAYVTAEQAFASGNRALAQTELEKLVGRFGGTAAGTQGVMLLAQLLYEEGKYAEGLTQLEGALRSAPKAMRPGLHALIGGGQEGSGKMAEAAAAYGRAAAATPFEAERDQFLMEQARAMVGGGDRAGAEGIYRSISDREDSAVAAEARLRLGELLASAP